MLAGEGDDVLPALPLVAGRAGATAKLARLLAPFLHGIEEPLPRLVNLLEYLLGHLQAREVAQPGVVAMVSQHVVQVAVPEPVAEVEKFLAHVPLRHVVQDVGPRAKVVQQPRGSKLHTLGKLHDLDHRPVPF